MSIINKIILDENFKQIKNLEKEIYNKIIKKYNSDIHTLKGFWYAMDNIKHYNNLNQRKTNQLIYDKIYKLSKKFK